MATARNLMAGSIITAMLGLSACQGGGVDSLFPKAEKPIPAELAKKMKAKGMTAASPIMVRIFKEENFAEVWKQTDTGRYDLLETYEICKWSGKLGPKFKEGDRQAPEGFYTVRPWQMNPNSEYHLSFNLGFPNVYDQAHGRTGSHLMMHGACSSAGCYSMTDERIEEIFALAREALDAGQKEFQVQAFPFRMTPENMAKHKDNPNFDFWKMIKEGYDHFEITRAPPKIDVCDKRYVFNRMPNDDDARIKATEPCPDMTMPVSLSLAYSKRMNEEEEIFQRVLKKQAIRDAFAGNRPDADGAAAQTPVITNQSVESGEVRAVIAGEAPADAADEIIAGDGAIPVPVPAPRAAAVAGEPKKRRGLFGLFAPRS